MLVACCCTSFRKGVPTYLKYPTWAISTTARGIGVGASAEAFAPEALLSAASRERCARALARLPPLPRSRGRPSPGAPPEASQGASPGAKAPRKAAVLVPLCEVNGDVALLYTLRAPSLSAYRGQVAFPGGMMEERDGGSAEATALREAREELGVEPRRVRVWGCGPWLGTARRDALVLPVLGHVENGGGGGGVDVAALRCCPREVECAFAVPLHRLCDPTHFRYTRFRNSYALPVFTAAEHRIWGLTAIITHVVLQALLPTVYTQQLPEVRYSLTW